MRKLILAAPFFTVVAVSLSSMSQSPTERRLIQLRSEYLSTDDLDERGKIAELMQHERLTISKRDLSPEMVRFVEEL